MILLAAYFFLAAAITCNKLLLYVLAPELLVALRMSIAAVLIGVYARIFHGCFSPSYSTLVVLLSSALATTFVPSNLKAYALAHMPSYKMAYFGTLDPFVAALYSYVLYRERHTIRQWVGILLGCVGMLLLVSHTPAEVGCGWLSTAEFAALTAIVVSRLGWMHAQKLIKQEQVEPLYVNSTMMAVSGMLSLGLFSLHATPVGSLASVSVPLLTWVPMSLLSSDWQLVVLLLGTIVLGNVIGYNLYAYALKSYSATFIALAGFSIPLLVQFNGWLVLGEPLSWVFFAACGVTFLGMLCFYADELAL